ncbi:MAG TPA: lysylphosphatidylglycerol synthase transmembrane domain-containing protein [Acidimicrobiales bacterium]
MHPADGPAPASPRSRRSMIPKWLRHGLLIFLILLVIEYLVIPELVGASKNLHLLSKLNIGWLVAGIGLEAGAIVSYAMLTRTLLPGGGPGLFKLVRIVLATTAVAHVIPGGAAGGAGVGYRLLTSNGVEGADAGFAMATEAIGSALVLNVMLWLALLISIPLAGLHPIYVVTALVGLLALFGAATLAYTLTRGGEWAVRVVRSVGRRIPRVGADRLERLVRQVGDSVVHLAQERALLKRALLWAGLNWLLDAASLWSFVTAFGHFVDPIELFAAYGIANVLGAIPITPGGLGVIEASAATLLVSFGVTRNIATLAVLGWRLVNFWLPIPIGGVAYISLRVPRGAGLRAQRQALVDMAADAKRPGQEPESNPTSEDATP